MTGRGLRVHADGLVRCWWPGVDPLYCEYHDEEWGRPVRDDRRLFEKLVLEGFQSGLSWLTILRKRENFRAAFDGFDFERVAGYGDRDFKRLMDDAGIVRNRAKIAAAIANAQATLELAEAGESLAALAWSFRADADPPTGLEDLAATTDESKALAKELKRRGFRFVGPTTAYALMQACGLVNDHLDGCLAR